MINECLVTPADPNDVTICDDPSTSVKAEKAQSKVLGLKPDLLALCTVSEKEQSALASKNNETEVVDDLNLEGLDDDEINGYILTESEAILKDRLWNKMNAEYLIAAKEREEKLAKEREEGKPEKKKRRARKKPIGPSSSAGEAIEKMLQEKKISSKINYDILKSLTATVDTEKVEKVEVDLKPIIIDESHLPRPSTSKKSFINLSNNRRSNAQTGLPVGESSAEDIKDLPAIVNDPGNFTMLYSFSYNFLIRIKLKDDIVDTEDEPEPETVETDRSDRLADMLNQGDDEEDFGYPEEDY